jgi:hypothetical protein
MLLHCRDNGMVGHVRQRHDRAIIGRRQITIVDTTEARPSGPAKMKMPHGPRRIGRQRLQHAQAIEHVLSVRLENFSPQALGWTGCLIQHDGADSLFRQRQGQDGSASPRPHHRYVGLFSHHASFRKVNIEVEFA